MPWAHSPKACGLNQLTVLWDGQCGGCSQRQFDRGAIQDRSNSGTEGRLRDRRFSHTQVLEMHGAPQSARFLLSRCPAIINICI